MSEYPFVVTYRIVNGKAHELWDGEPTFNIREFTDDTYRAWLDAGNTPEEEKQDNTPEEEKQDPPGKKK